MPQVQPWKDKKKKDWRREPPFAEADLKMGGSTSWLDVVLKKKKKKSCITMFFKLKQLYEECNEAFIKQANKPKSALFSPFFFQESESTCLLPLMRSKAWQRFENMLSVQRCGLLVLFFSGDENLKVVFWVMKACYLGSGVTRHPAGCFRQGVITPTVD